MAKDNWPLGAFVCNLCKQQKRFDDFRERPHLIEGGYYKYQPCKTCLGTTQNKK